MELHAFSKINLDLKILGRRDDGYHEVRTLLQTIDWADDIQMETSDRFEFIEHGVEAGENNLVVKAVRAFEDLTGEAVRARIELRKNVPAGLAVAEALGADYWLTGPEEDGYGPELARLLAATRCRVHRRLPAGLTMDDAYVACDAVVFPSTWEGFGAPLIEAALHGRPLAVGEYPVAAELAAFGFTWFPAADPAPLRSFLDHPDPALLKGNAEVARRHFSMEALGGQIAALLEAAGWDRLLAARGQDSPPMSTW